MSGAQTNALFYAMKALRPRSGHGASVRSVLFVLANFYNERTHCAWPAVNTLAEAAGVSKNTALKAIDSLVVLGLVVVLPTKRRDSGAQGPNLYRFPQYCELPVDMSGDTSKAAGRRLAQYELVDGTEFDARRAKAKQTVARKKQPPQLIVLQDESQAPEPDGEPFVSRRRQRRTS